jgi:hypothetical protein
MQPPATSEEKDRRENLSNKIAVVSDIMALLSDIEDTASKLKILKSLLSNVLTDSEVTDVIQEEIDKLENESIEDNITDDDANSIDSENIDFDMGGFSGGSPDSGTEEDQENRSSGEDLPSPQDLGIDMTNNNNSDFD